MCIRDRGELKTVFGVEEFGNSMLWYSIRMASLITINVVVGLGIYALFKRAGVIGGDAKSAKA